MTGAFTTIMSHEREIAKLKARLAKRDKELKATHGSRRMLEARASTAKGRARWVKEELNQVKHKLGTVEKLATLTDQNSGIRHESDTLAVVQESRLESERNGQRTF
ncbi:hypothetical protein LWI28_028990 [Acer negundo]|uniref:Uncharacterized protein n=1 Tax=Acer negundo TaxID=4023 RepID=A0AAD5P0L2_ACENE|nr:hypothetical protein LWI28_019520 [Acer negundo]KAI9192887.1 hypothetical protein LWI28_028990 [Acer negundo]